MRPQHQHQPQQQQRHHQQLPLLVVAVLLLAAAAQAADSSYEYDYGNYDGTYGGADAASGSSEYALDDYGYYGSDDEAYYEEYGVYSDADSSYALGYDDYDYLDYGSAGSGGSGSGGCTEKDGKAQLGNGTVACDLKLSGVDSLADLLESGVDGLYQLAGCHNGYPKYKRKDSPAGEERVLWYSKGFADWDLSRGAAPNDNDILVYGTDPSQHALPLFVQAWHLGADLTTNKPNGTSDETYVPVKLSLTCADGQKVAPPAVTPAQQRVGPILTDDEMEQKYKAIYEKYGRRPEPNPTMNFSFVVMLVMIGLTVVLAIPYMLVNRNGSGSSGSRGGKGYQPVSTTGSSFAQVIQQSKKKQSGHIH